MKNLLWNRALHLVHYSTPAAAAMPAHKAVGRDTADGIARFFVHAATAFEEHNQRQESDACPKHALAGKQAVDINLVKQQQGLIDQSGIKVEIICLTASSWREPYC
jgi:hypothetical protein